MKKRVLLLSVIALMMFSAIPVLAASNPVVYQNTLTVTAAGGKYEVGFVTLEFKKDFLDPEMLPATFEVSIYADDGIGYIEFSPDTPDFAKKVHIKVAAYQGPLFDKALGENIDITIKRQQLLVDHFSAYSFPR